MARPIKVTVSMSQKYLSQWERNIKIAMCGIQMANVCSWRIILRNQIMFFIGLYRCCFENIVCRVDVLKSLIGFIYQAVDVFSFHLTLYIYDNFGTRSRYLGHGLVIASHSIVSDAVTYTCPIYLLLAHRSSYMLPGVSDGKPEIYIYRYVWFPNIKASKVTLTTICSDIHIQLSRTNQALL